MLRILLDGEAEDGVDGLQLEEGGERLEDGLGLGEEAHPLLLLTTVLHARQHCSQKYNNGSVADLGCLSRIPDPNFFHPGSRILEPHKKI